MSEDEGVCEDKCEGARMSVSVCGTQCERGLKAEAGESTQGHREEPTRRDKQLKLVPVPLRLDDSELFRETEEPGSRVSRQETAEGCCGPSSRHRTSSERPSLTYKVSVCELPGQTGPSCCSPISCTYKHCGLFHTHCAPGVLRELFLRYSL